MLSALVAILGGSSRPPQRRSAGGSRHEASERVTLKSGAVEIQGWTLNVSRGGVRVVLEDPVVEGQDYDFLMGDADSSARKIRVVWLRQQADGEIAGLQFLDVDGSVPGPPDDTP